MPLYLFYRLKHYSHSIYFKELDMLDIKKYSKDIGMEFFGIFNEKRKDHSSKQDQKTPIKELTDNEKEDLTKRGKLLRQAFYKNSNRLYKLNDDYKKLYTEVEKHTEELRGFGYFSNKEISEEAKIKGKKIISLIIKVIDKMTALAKELNDLSDRIMSVTKISFIEKERDFFEIDSSKLGYYDSISIGQDLTDYPWRGLYELSPELEESIMKLLHQTDVMDKGNSTDDLSRLLGL